MIDYEQYIQSDHWKRIARQRLEIDGYTCQLCGTHGTMWNVLQVHHINYRSLGNENVYTDLICLCDHCHRHIHKMMNRQTSADGKHGWRDQLPSSVMQHHVVDLALDE